MTRFTVDWRYIEIERELWALGEFLDRIEPQIVYLSAQDEIRTAAQLQEQGLAWEEADTQIAFQEIRERAERVFPRFLRGPFVLSLWACFESSVTELANSLAGVESAGLRLRDVRGDHFVDGARRYFSTVLRAPLDSDADRLERIRDLLTVRNIFAHSNGQQRMVAAEKWKSLESVANRRAGVLITDGLLLLSDVYLRGAFADVNGSVRDLVLRVRGGPVSRPIE